MGHSVITMTGVDDFNRDSTRKKTGGGLGYREVKKRKDDGGLIERDPCKAEEEADLDQSHQAGRSG